MDCSGLACRFREVGIDWVSTVKHVGRQVGKANPHENMIIPSSVMKSAAAPLWADPPRQFGKSKFFGCLAIFAMLWLSGIALRAQDQNGPITDITAKYHFLSADDTLAILDEEGRLKGYVDVFQGEEESDEVLSYNIVDGTRKKTHVEFRTNKIHGRSYRFSGNVERGAGHQEGDPDYLRLVGDVEVVTAKADAGGEAVRVVRVLLKSFGKNERQGD